MVSWPSLPGETLTTKERLKEIDRTDDQRGMKSNIQDSDSQGLGAALCRIPVFRPVALELLRVLDDESTSVLEVADLVSSDPSLCAELLITSNSAAYATRRAINTVPKAIAVLGIEKTKGIALRASLEAMQRGIGKHHAVENTWAHSRAAGVIAEWLAPYYRFHPDRAYIAGLLHDIGRLGLLAIDLDRYGSLLEQASGTQKDLLDAESALFRLNHCEAGLWLTRTWGLPQELWTVCSRHHSQRVAIEDDEMTISRLACDLAHGLGYRAAPQVQAREITEILAELPVRQLPAPSLPESVLWNRLKLEVGYEPRDPDTLVTSDIAAAIN
jgi:HD-like signal output (HDOD) protein